MNNSYSKQSILLGAGGHASVVLATALNAGIRVDGVCDPALVEHTGSLWKGVRILGNDSWLLQSDPNVVSLLNGVGYLPDSDVRARIHKEWSTRGFRFETLIHSRAWVEPTVKLGEGTQVMAGAIVQAEAEIGAGSIVNTSASIDHHCRIGALVHIAPGATLCGGVEVGERAFVGAGATIVQGVRIGPGAIVPAGSMVKRDLPH
jgi:UDP-perosamine 4-acetyltransferase